MPIYEYRCNKCGEFEVVQKITDPQLKKCPTCRAKVTKLISNTSFQLKGSGWYITDYGRGGSKSKEKGTESKTEAKDSASEKTTSTSDSSSSKSESKSSKKTETKASGSKEAAAA